MSSMIVYLIFVPILAAVLLLLNIFLGPHNPYSSKSSAFECGFHSFLGQNRQQFSISFFLFALLFLLFDLEILLIYPYSVSAYNNEAYGLWIVLIFLAVLTVGFVFEIGKGALKLYSRQTTYLQNNKLNAMANLNVSGPKSRSSLSRSANHVSSILSRQHVSSSKRHYSTCANSVDTKVLLDPNFVTGFADGESCFFIGTIKNKKLKAGWEVRAIFSMSLHEKDRPLLELIQGFFRVGKIYKKGKDQIQFRVTSPQELQVVINHFDKYPLITQKRADFELFKSVVDLINRGEHLTPDGLQKIVNLRASLNNGLSDELKAAFPNTEPVPRPKVVELRHFYPSN